MNARNYDPMPGTVTMTHVVYGLHAITVIPSLIASAFFPWGLSVGTASIVGVIINYVLRGDVRGTWLESHFDLQIMLFWRAVLFIAGVFLLSFPLLILGPIGVGLLWVAGLAFLIWFSWRLISGWRALAGGETAPH